MPDTRILVADAQSTDKTRAVVESFRDRLNLEIIEGGLPSIGRNRGAQQADTRYVLFVDADVIVRPYLVGRSLDYLRAPWAPRGHRQCPVQERHLPG